MQKRIFFVNFLQLYRAPAKGLSGMASLPFRFLTPFALRLFILIFLVYLNLFCLSALETEKLLTPSGVTVELYYRTLQPGEIIIVSIKNPSAIKEAQVRFLKRKYVMGRNEVNSELLAFISLDLELEPGLYTIEIFINKAAGGWEFVKKQVQVVAREFPLKRLWVDERYIKPPPEFKERIRMENDILSIIFGIVSERWLGEGRFILPSSGEVYPNFGQRRIYNNEQDSLHRGVDISERYGTPVRASNSGKVVLASDLYFAGKAIIVDHGIGLFTIYCHLSKIEVKRGAMVKKGEIIGKVGATGRAIGPHLHWGVEVSGISVDPFSLLSFAFE